MTSYIILSKFHPGALSDPKEFKERAATVSARIRSECPAVRWKESFGTTGCYDVIDLVESDDPGQVDKAALIIKKYGLSQVEIMFATPWKEWLDRL